MNEIIVDKKAPPFYPINPAHFRDDMGVMCLH